MGLLVEGVWRDEWYDTAATGGKFERPATSYRDWIEAGGRFSPQAGRYHLWTYPGSAPGRTERSFIAS